MRIIAVSLAGLLAACNNWLDVKPADRVTEDQVFTTESGFWGALNGIYTEFLSTDLYGGALGHEMVEIMAQRYNIASAQKNYNQLLTYAYSSDYAKQRLQSCWEAAYKLILDCNSILENTDKHRDILDDKAYHIVRGEVLALRAFLHFDMLRLFGPLDAGHSEELSIPYNEKVSVSASSLLPAKQVVEKVLTDLTQAENDLKQYDPVVSEGLRMSVSGNAEEGNTYRFRGLRLNYYAVLALKARVYLYADRKPEALTYAKMLIEEPKREDYFPFVSFSEVTNGQNPDRVFSSEVLFSMLNDTRNVLYTSYFDPENASNKLMPRENSIETLFGDERVSDYRYKWWQASAVAGESNLLVNIKLKGISDTDLVYGKLMALIRLSEMYLIAAECETDENLGYNWLNTLRRQRGLVTEISEKLQDRLADEYNKEFLNEGQLFFYYKRKGTTTLKSGTTGKNIQMSKAAYVPPLPESEEKYRN